jgi:6-hydroxy-3-succinoylpyridine 3-monooxygenase
LKTRIYVDGYNLYYGCLRNTAYKWLDLKKLLLTYILPSSVPFPYSVDPVSVKFYTARILEKAGRSHDSVADQDAYHRALRMAYVDKSVEIIEGYYSIDKVSAYLIDSDNANVWPKDCQRANIWKLEEKQSDVNLALDSVVDSILEPGLEHIVFVTNDTDIAPALRKIKQVTTAKIGLIIPTRKSERNPNAELAELADWTRTHITVDELSLSLLPRTITGLKKSVNRPISWFGQPAIVQDILNVLEEVIPSLAKRWKWLDEIKPSPEGLPVLNDIPSNLLDFEATALDVLQHARAYVEYRKNRK